MFGFFKKQHLSHQILDDVLEYTQAHPKEREVFREATALSMGITMRMISRWPQEREPLYLVLQDIRHRLHPDGARLLSQQFSNSAQKARGTGRKSLMYGYGMLAFWHITSAQLVEKETAELKENIERYDQFFCKLFEEHSHLLSEDGLNQLHETFYILKPGQQNSREQLKQRSDSFRV